MTVQKVDIPEARQESIATLIHDIDQEGMKRRILFHLWMPSSKSCSCGERSTLEVGRHYIWWAGHVAGYLVAEGFGRVTLP